MNKISKRNLKLTNTLDLEELELLLGELYDKTDEKKIYILTDASKVKYNYGLKDLDFITRITKKHIDKANVMVIEALIIKSPSKLLLHSRS